MSENFFFSFNGRMFTFLAAVDELASVHALNSQEVLFPGFVPVWVPEMNYSQRGTTTRVMDDVLQKKKHFTLTSCTNVTKLQLFL